MSNTSKKFITGALILTVAGMFARFLSIFFRIPLANLIGSVGMGYYQLAYPIYTLLLAISYVGLPSAVSKLVSEKMANEDYDGANRIFRISLVILIIVGSISSLLLFLGADWVIKVRNWSPEVKYSILGLTMAPLFVSIMGAFRGYFQGMQNMLPTAISQLVESFIRVIVGIGLAYIIFTSNSENADVLGMAAGGASFGATAGAVVGVIILIIMYLKYRKKIKQNIKRQKVIQFNKKANCTTEVIMIVAVIVSWLLMLGCDVAILYKAFNYCITFYIKGQILNSILAGIFGAASIVVLSYVWLKCHNKLIKKDEDNDSIRSISRNVFLIAMPITIGAAMSSIIGIIDSMIIVSRLRDVGLSEKVATGMFGKLTGEAMTLINVPMTLATAIGLSVLPAVANAIARKDKEELHSKIDVAIRFGLLLGFPAAIGLGALAYPIFDLLYPKDVDGSVLLSILSIALVFMILSQIFTAILQGMGHFYIPIINLLIVAACKWILNYNLVATPLYVSGAAIASIIVYFIYMILNYIYIKKKSGYKIKNYSIILKPTISTIVMGLSTMAIYYTSRDLTHSSKAGTLIAITAGVIVYIIMVILTKTLTESELRGFPKGNLIVKVFKKLRLI